MGLARGQWSALHIYLGDGRVEIDNNLVENAIRPTAIGKKNWLFIGEAGAGQRGAIIYTLIECCRRRGLDPYTSAWWHTRGSRASALFILETRPLWLARFPGN